jgi:hypothetical protein
MTVIRRLTAILAAEVVGYSRLMEQHAFTALIRLLLALVGPGAMTTVCPLRSGKRNSHTEG